MCESCAELLEVLNESKCGRPPPLPSPQHSSPRAGTPRTLLYTGWVITPLHLLPYPPPPHPLPFPARRLARASWARGYLSLCGVAVEGEPALLCSFLPLPSSPYRGWATCGLGRVGRGAVPAGPFAEGPPPLPPFPPAPRVSACGAGRGRDPAVGVRSPLLALHPREAAAGPSWLLARLRRCLGAAPVAAEQLEAGPGLGSF